MKYVLPKIFGNAKNYIKPEQAMVKLQRMWRGEVGPSAEWSRA